MRRRIVLDSGVVGLLTHPEPSPTSLACRDWMLAALADGDGVILPEVVDYEIRRDYLLRNNQRGLRRLEALGQQITYEPLKTHHWRSAAALWATARKQGHITAPPHDLNIDMLLAAIAQALVAPDIDVVIATTNVRHLAPFADARLWQDI